MNTIYVAHSRNFDFKKELYEPLRTSALSSTFTFILPHEQDEFVNSKETIQNAEFVLAEVSFPSTSEGIELGWANALNVPIICIHKDTSTPSSALKTITDTFISYADPEELIRKLEQFLSDQN